MRLIHPISIARNMWEVRRKEAEARQKEARLRSYFDDSIEAYHRQAISHPGQSPKVAVVYVCPTVRDTALRSGIVRFIDTYMKYPSRYDHELHVVFNGEHPASEVLALFDGIDYVSHFHDNEGWDIGAYLTTVREIECDMIACFGTYTYFTQPAWLERMAATFAEHGPGLFGASGSYEIWPHIRTAGFWCHPELLQSYMRPTSTHEERYAFEHGEYSLTAIAEHLGLPCLAVTWDEVLSKPEWRTPDNIFRRGDQSNALFRDKLFDVYETWNDRQKRHFAALADGYVINPAIGISAPEA